MMNRVAGASPCFKARMAGVLYLFSVVTAVLGEFLIPGRLDIAAVIIPVSCYMAMTLLLYGIFKPVNRGLALLAASFNLVGLTFEGLQLQPRGVNIGMIFHGCYCLLMGYLIFRSTFLPRILGALMAFAGLCWLTHLWPPLASHLYPGITAPGLLGEGLPMLWLLVMGVSVPRWKEQATAAAASIRAWEPPPVPDTALGRSRRTQLLGGGNPQCPKKYQHGVCM